MQNTRFSKEDMVRKVAGLLNTAESFAEQGNDEAAASYVQKAHELQQKWSIDQALLDEQNGTKTEKVISKRIRMTGKWGKRKVTLAHVIADATNCTGYFTTGYGKKMGPNLEEVTDWDGPKIYYYVCFGFESDVDHVEFLVNSLSSQLDQALVHAAKNKSSWEHGRSFNSSFCMGFASTIGARLRAASREAQKIATAEQVAGSTSVSLVLASKKRQVEEEMKAQGIRLGKGSSTTSNSYSGYAAGKEAGSRATIARGSVNTGSKGSLGR